MSLNLNRMNVTNVFIGLGSNMGNKKSTIISAIDKISCHNAIEIVQISNYYYSEPWGFESKEYFLNCVLELQTNLSPVELLTVFKTIEYELGRIKKLTKEYQNRTIDIDILYFNNQIVDQNELKVPHQRLRDRLFVLKPLSEIAPKFKDPISEKTMEELLRLCKDTSNIYTETFYLNEFNRVKVDQK